MKKGFTLIELMVVIAVIAILSVIALFGIQKAQAAARDTQRQSIGNAFRTSLARYYGDNGAYPSNLTALTSSYLNPAPVDPGCGTGGTYTYAGANSWAICGGVSYVYSTNNSGYTITMYKESGGSSVFKSPQ